MTRTQELQQKIDATSGRLAEMSERIERYNVAIGEAMIGAQPNEEAADKLQVERDTLRREQERGQLRLQALQNELPQAEKEDAEERMAELHAEAATLADRAHEMIDTLDVLLEQLNTLLPEAFAPALRRRDLKAEQEFWMLKFGVEAAPLAVIPEPNFGKIKHLYQVAGALAARLNDVWVDWEQRVANLRSELKRHRVQEERKKVVPLIAA
jgi:predicted  nucleic acid-binding Zn-ribbon protein